MAMVKTLFQQLAPRSEDPGAIICEINAALYGSIKSNMFVTFVVAIFDASTGSMTISNAGHNPTMIYRAKDETVEQFRLGGPPLGAFGSMHFNDLVEVRDVQLHPGDAALLYTDGVNESRNPGGELYSIPRIVQTLRSHASGGARAIVNGIVGETTEFRQGVPQGDDVTLLVIRAPSEVPAQALETSEARE
jgi:serine phosphatase RsbU (regulator of sigma subunit)